MPNDVAGSFHVLDFIAREVSPNAWVNVMDQYHPEHKAFDYPEISRRITDGEYRQAIQWAKASSLTNLD